MIDGGLSFKWVENPTWQQIESSWQQLLQSIEPMLFRSIAWVKTWATLYKNIDWLLLVLKKDELISASLWNKKHHKRRFGFNATTMHLHHTGIERCDQIWPEYCFPLVKPEHRNQLGKVLVQNVFEFHKDVNEIDTGLMLLADYNLLDTSNTIIDIQFEDKAYVFQQSDGPELESNKFYSKGLRSELKRTKKGLDQNGEHSVSFETNPEKCATLFTDMADQHKTAWGHTSGFYNPDFIAFHTQLITSKVDVQPILATLQQEESILSRHYLLGCGNTLYFYLGVAQKHLASRLKPGIFLHAATIDKLKDLGYSNYDFMGGDFLYKRRFANRTLDLIRARIKSRSIKHVVEKGLKRIYSSMSNRFTKKLVRT